jgi:asparagine synthase (glutamine-hydrolysing)
MCGINGYFSFVDQTDSDRYEKELKIKTMNNKIIHRGPDSEGIINSFPAIFGFRRLSIIDLRPESNQPMQSRDGNFIIIFNGEIYNYKELRYELLKKGYSFSTESDTEVILNSYKEYGDECVNKFNGMWAFAIYDINRNRLFCSRDRLGVKPFYYVNNCKELYFSSELKALHTACNLHQAEHTKVFEYIAYGYKANDGKTFFEGCAELLPGYNLIIENNQLTISRYWTLKPNLHSFSFKDAKLEFMELFKDAISIRYRSDVPVALLLSGGLDSTAIAKVTDELIESGNIKQNRVQAFIASFPGYQYDETEIAKQFVKTCKYIDLHELHIDSSALIERLDGLIYGFDSPVASFTTIAHHNIMKECKNRGIKVVLNGQGSDEAFAGYDRYVAGIHLLDQLFANKSEFIKEFSTLNRLNGYSFPFLISQMMKGLFSPAFASYLRAKYQEKTMQCLNSDFVSKNISHYESNYSFSSKGNNLEEYLLSQINFQGLNQILHYEDISSMQESIEIRSPFMDYRIMEFAFSIGNEYKLTRGVTKKIIRDTIGKQLPDNIVKNRKKIGFKTPFTDYLTKDESMGKYCRELFGSREFLSRKIYNQKSVLKVINNINQYPQFPLWRTINLEVWANQYEITNL